jgi:TfoX/Sxy family transcriptional regulator of competence genes
MSQSHITPEERFAIIVEELLGNPGVTPPLDGTQAKKRFGSSELKVNDKIFAMLVRGRLVVKLPKLRVDALIASGTGERFDPRHDGRLMKEWITLEPMFAEEWLPLAREAMEFVGTKR